VAGSAERPHRRSLTLRTFQTLLITASAGFGLVITTSTAGYANPTPSPSEIEVQIDQQWNALEPLIEKYNAVHDQFTAMQGKVNKLQSQIQPLAIKVDLAMARVGAVSAQMYRTGPGSKLNALLTGTTPDQFVNQITMLDEMARGEAATVADVAKLKAQYEEQKKPLDVALAALRQQDAQLTSQQQTIKAKITQLNSLRLAAYGSTSGTGNLRPVTCPQVYTGDAGSKAARFACQQIGKAYVFATAGPDTYDCSGLTLASWRTVGVTLPHNAAEQKQITTSVGFSDLRPGDLVYYFSDVHHVTIYVGNGWVVSAPTYGEPVGMRRYNASPVNGFGRPHS
jgi:cell wall-associated NlpC family hydrolase